MNSSTRKINSIIRAFYSFVKNRNSTTFFKSLISLSSRGVILQTISQIIRDAGGVWIRPIGEYNSLEVMLRKRHETSSNLVENVCVCTSKV